jgi:hypothetical protein
MKLKHLNLHLVILLWATVFACTELRAAVINASWNYPGDIAIMAPSYIATGNSVSFTLNCVPTANELTVIRNTGPAFGMQ